ncbi:hypothetical protein SCHPADRAFT_840869, partial [Schizopora paradoxa]
MAENQEEGPNLPQVIAVDPHPETCPDFSHADFEADRAQLSAYGLNDDVVLQILADKWTAKHNALCEQWDALHPPPPMSQSSAGQQPSDDQNQPPPSPSGSTLQSDEPHPIGTVETSSGNMPKKAEIKIDEGQPIPDVITHQVARIALQRLRDRKHVALYYFTLRGRAEANEQGLTTATSDNLKLETSTDGTMRLSPASLPLPLKHVRPDRELSPPEIHEGAYKFLEEIGLAGWGKASQSMWARCFYNVDTHHIVQDPDGPAALALYLERVRLEWH